MDSRQDSQFLSPTTRDASLVNPEMINVITSQHAIARTLNIEELDGERNVRVSQMEYSSINIAIPESVEQSLLRSRDGINASQGNVSLAQDALEDIREAPSGDHPEDRNVSRIFERLRVNINQVFSNVINIINAAVYCDFGRSLGLQPYCRICDRGTEWDPLIYVCSCTKETKRKVHLTCVLDRMQWNREKRCQECHEEYRFDQLQRAGSKDHSDHDN